MKKIKGYVSITLALLFITMLLSGCSQPGSTASDNTPTHTITDSAGRQVEIPTEIKKAAVLDAFMTEAIVMSQGGEQIVSCPAGTKRNVLLKEIYPEIETAVTVTSSGVINAEALMELKPDVVLIKREIYQSEAEAQKLDKLGIPYVVVSYDNMAEQIEALRLIASVMGGRVAQNMETLCQEYERVITLCEERSARIPESERVKVYHSITEAVRTDGENSLGSDWIKTVGCTDVSVGSELKSEGDDYYASIEQIFVWDPDVVICNDASTAEYFKTNEKFQGLRAVRENQVYNIPIGFTRWGHQGSCETFFGMLWLGTTVYPEVYGDIDLRAEVTDFYQNVAGIQVDDALWDKILSGRDIRQGGKNSGK